MRLYDSHNHLHDERLRPFLEDVMARTAGITRMVVNGSCESDWPAVLALARSRPQVLPSFGYHPWYVGERSPQWREVLIQHLDSIPSAVGEIGLDRWMKDPDLPAQQEVFAVQMELAAARNLPVSIHCLKAWGALYDQLRTGPRPACGFLLHSYGGPLELVEPLARLGAYFSLPGFFAQERKTRQRETFRHVPRERLLIETDAPDQPLPDSLNLHPLKDPASGKALNHPANVVAVYGFASELLGVSLPELAGQVEHNFLRLFGHLI